MKALSRGAASLPRDGLRSSCHATHISSMSGFGPLPPTLMPWSAHVVVKRFTNRLRFARSRPGAVGYIS